MNLDTIAKLLASKTLNQIKKDLCGELLGRGAFRDVYALKDSTRYVVKIELYDAAQPMFCNITEWRNWCNHKEWKFLSDYMAPCLLITLDGQVLIQRRVEFRDKKLYPKRIPAMFTDLHTKNFGFIGDQFVCCDYPMLLVSVGKSMRTVKVWRDQTPGRIAKTLDPLKMAIRAFEKAKIFEIADQRIEKPNPKREAEKKKLLLMTTPMGIKFEEHLKKVLGL